jgi:hypothetical protein
MEGQISSLKDYTTLLRDTFQACHLHQVRYMHVASSPGPSQLFCFIEKLACMYFSPYNIMHVDVCKLFIM